MSVTHTDTNVFERLDGTYGARVEVRKGKRKLVNTIPEPVATIEEARAWVQRVSRSTERRI